MILFSVRMVPSSNTSTPPGWRLNLTADDVTMAAAALTCVMNVSVRFDECFMCDIQINMYCIQFSQQIIYSKDVIDDLHIHVVVSMSPIQNVVKLSLFFFFYFFFIF